MSIRPFDNGEVPLPGEWKIQRWTAVRDVNEKVIRETFIKMVNYTSRDEKALDFEIQMPFGYADNVQYLGGYSELEFQSLQPCLLDEVCDNPSQDIIEEWEDHMGEDITCGNAPDVPFCAVAIFKPKESRKYASSKTPFPVVFFGKVKRHDDD